MSKDFKVILIGDLHLLILLTKSPSNVEQSFQQIGISPTEKVLSTSQKSCFKN